jgi:hypothetical protein
MRDKNRLYDFYDELRDIHIKYFPDLRFTQLVEVVNNYITKYHYVDSFYVEEKAFIGYLKEYTKQIVGDKYEERG